MSYKRPSQRRRRRGGWGEGENVPFPCVLFYAGFRGGVCPRRQEWVFLLNKLTQVLSSFYLLLEQTLSETPKHNALPTIWTSVPVKSTYKIDFIQSRVLIWTCSVLPYTNHSNRMEWILHFSSASLRSAHLRSHSSGGRGRQTSVSLRAIHCIKSPRPTRAI
jgi:hypothetical protein